MNRVFQHLHLPAELAIEFMAELSRFEYALKSTKYAVVTDSRVNAAWDRFANEIDDEFQSILIKKLNKMSNQPLNMDCGNSHATS